MQTKLGYFALASVLLATFESVEASPVAMPEAANGLAARVSIVSLLSCVVPSNAHAPLTFKQAPSTGNIYVCTAWDWQGSCTNVQFNNAQCTNFPSGFQDDISSIGPDGGWKCTIYV